MNFPYHFLTNQQLFYLPPPGVAAPPATTCPGGIGPNLAALADGAGNLVAPVAALLNAAWEVGVYPGDPTTLAGTLLNGNEMQWRTFSLLTTVSALPGGYLGTTPVYDEVTASEAGALSFQMGQVFCALVAQAAGVAPGNFMHLDRWLRVAPAVPITFRSNRVPDFLSQMGPNAFQVWEAKCRNTQGVAWATLRDGFSQAWSVATVAGLAPTAHVATLARTDPGNGNRWELYVVDPGEEEPAPVSPEVQDGVFRQYYAPFAGIIERSAKRARKMVVGGVPFVAVPRSGADCWLGLDQRILALLGTGAGGQKAGALSAALGRILGEGYVNRGERQFVNLNGVLAVAGASWLAL
jgi:hypothetical protein